MDSNNTKALVNAALASALAVIIGIIGLFVPFMSIVTFLWPVPVIIIINRYGFKYGVYVTIISAFIVGIISQPLYAIFVILGFGAIGLSIGFGVRKNYSAGLTLIIASLASLVSKLLLIYIVTRVMGANPIDIFIESMEKSIELSSELYKSMGLKNVEDATKTFMTSIEVFKMILPASFIFASVLDSYLNYIIARMILKRFKLDMQPFPPFASWKFPNNVSLGFIMLAILTYVGGYLGLKNSQDIMINIFWIFYLLFLIQGFAVVYHYLVSKGLPKIVRIIILVFISINRILAFAIVIIGLLDGIFNFRKLSADK